METAMLELLNKISEQFAMRGDAVSPVVRWGVLLIALIILWFAMVEPFLVWRSERFDALSNRISKVERMVAMQQVAETWINAEQDFGEAIKAVGPLFIDGDSYAVAQSKLTALVRKQAASFHMTVKSQHLRDSEPVAGLGEAIGVDLNMQGKLADALALVDVLVRFPRLLTIDSLYIAPAPGTGTVSSRGETTVLLMLGIRGYRLQGGQLQP